MNQNQIDRLYKVAISRNAYLNKMAGNNPEKANGITYGEFATPGKGERETFEPDPSKLTANREKAVSALPAAESPAAVEEAESPAAVEEAESPAANSPTGFDINKFIDSIRNRASNMSDTVSNIAHNPNVQIGAGIGAAGLAGYGIYNHFNKKKKRHEDED